MVKQRRVIYLLGPPFRDRHDITCLTAEILEMLFRGSLIGLTVTIKDGPVIYKSNYVLNGEGRQRLNRPGMNCMTLWMCLAECYGTHLPLDSFTVLVEDDAFLSMAADRRSQCSPRFETFIVSSPVEDRVVWQNVFEWRTTPYSWLVNRGDFIHDPFNHHKDVCNLQIIVATLRKPEWSGIWSIANLLPIPPSTSRRNRQRSKSVLVCNELQRVSEKLFLDCIFPRGLPTFLANCAPRPKSFECLSRALYDFEFPSNVAASPLTPAWLSVKGILQDTETSYKLSQWWWSAFICQVAQHVQQLTYAKNKEMAVYEKGLPVPGLTKAMLKKLQLDRHSLPHPLTLLEVMKSHSVLYHEINLEGEKCLVCKGLHVQSVWAYICLGHPSVIDMILPVSLQKS